MFREFIMMASPLRGPVERIKAGGRWIADRFRGRPDSEHEMVLNRVVIAIAVATYVGTANWFGSDITVQLQATVAVFATMSIVFLAHLLIAPGSSRVRRILAMLTDMGALSFALYFGGEATTLLYPFYLWAIFGNGFRFGLKYLFVTMAVALFGFSTVVWLSPYWSAHPQMVSGLLLGLVMLPLYAATLIGKLSAARLQAEEASRAKSLFLASVSHELRTPLNAVIGYSDLLLDGRLESEQRDMIQTIGTAGRSLLTLINSVLDFSRIEAGRKIFSIVEMDLYRLTSDVRALVAVQAGSKGVRLTTHITARTPRLLNADKVHLEEVLVNLAANAVKFTDAGYVCIAIDMPRVTEKGAVLRVEVSDTGIGIAPDAQARIFESFTQADETIIDRFGGTGLGLSICKQIVEQQGGRIGVGSILGRGSTFWFELPVGISSADGKGKLPNRPVFVLSKDIQVFDRVSALWTRTHHAASLDEARDLLSGDLQQPPFPLILIDENFDESGADQAAQALTASGIAPASMVLVKSSRSEDFPAEPLRSRYAMSISRRLEQQYFARLLGTEAQAQQGADAGQLCQPRPGSLRRLCILIAEDNKTNQKVISKVLERAGYDSQIADNGDAALDALVLGHFDLVLMDVNMPVLNGIEATKLYRVAALGSDHVPIVALTADASAEVRRRCLDAGMDECLTKPIEPARMVEVIERLTKLHPKMDWMTEAPPVAQTTSKTMPSHDDADFVSSVLPLVEAAAPEAPASRAADDKVVAISAHPNFRSRSTPVLDENTLVALHKLGDTEFVRDLAQQFIGDTETMIQELNLIVRVCDTHAFADRLHALRSAAANVGAQRIFEMCLEWRQVSAEKLTDSGADYCVQLREEFEQAKSALQARTKTSKASSAMPALV